MPFDEDELIEAVQAVASVAVKSTVPLARIKGSPDGPALDFATGVLVQVARERGELIERVVWDRVHRERPHPRRRWIGEVVRT